jgi:hypothetical protein
MSDFIKVALLVLLVVLADMLLCLLVPASLLVEFLAVFMGGLAIAAGISLLNNLIHRHKIQQLLRELELERQRRQLPPGRQPGNPHQTLQRRPRRLRGSCHS